MALASFQRQTGFYLWPIQASGGNCYPSEELLLPTLATMKPLKTKAQVRAEIDKQVKDFLQDGGEVFEVAQGVSGRETGLHPPAPVTFDGPKVDRTPVNEVVAAIESRRRAKPDPKPGKRKGLARKPRKKMILDDFGQPLRWEWVEE